MNQQTCKVLQNLCLKGEYWEIRFQCPEIAAEAKPGQFVNVLVPGIEGHILRRPFSICNAADGIMTLVYKTVGTGSRALTAVRAGDTIDVLGPLGHGFTALPADRRSLLLGGGYGCAAMYYTALDAVAKGLPAPVVLLGARSAADILLAERFAEAGCEVRISTDDGSLGTQGRITVLLEEALKETPDAWIASCGPRPMLKAVAKMAEAFPESYCEVSLDENMCCGVGACFGCVLKCKADNENGWVYRRSCHDGPVFLGSEIYWD